MVRPDSKTTSTVTYPIVSALLMAEEFLGDKFTKLTPTNEMQKTLLESIYRPSRNDVTRLSEEEVKSIADKSSEVINKWLEENGFNIKLNPFGDDGFGVASILNILGKWALKGTDYTLMTEDEELYPAVKMSDYGLKAHKVDEDENLIIQFETKSSDQVFMMMTDSVPRDLALVEHVETLSQNKKAIEFGYSGVVFPKIDMDMEADIGWLKGLRLEVLGEKLPHYQVTEALQQTKLKMNEIGFRVKSAVAIAAVLAAPLKRREPYIINRPFLMWIERPQFAKPLFAAYLDRDVWKDPKGLDM
jgi:hypothetical protein